MVLMLMGAMAAEKGCWVNSPIGFHCVFMCVMCMYVYVYVYR